MKMSSKLITAIVITLLLSIVALPVWATPQRQGTVPNPPDEAPITNVIPVTGGGYRVNLLCDCEYSGLVTRVNELDQETSPSVAPYEYLSEEFEVELDGPCDIEICYPYPVDYENKFGQIFKLGNQQWNLIDSMIYEEEDPRLICTVDRSSTGGTYALISTEQSESEKLPFKVTMCGCDADINMVADPATTVGAAPDGFEFLNNSAQVDSSETCEIEVCFPYTDDEKSKDGQIYQWDSGDNQWVLAQNEISSFSNQICTTYDNSLGGVFALLGKK